MKINELFSRIKKIKHKEIWIAVTIGLFVCVGYFCFVSSPSKKSDTTSETSTEDIGSDMEYVNMLENKLSNVLSKISGVGDVNVIITLESGFSYEYATDTETKTTTSGGTQTSITTQTIIYVKDQPVIVSEIYPVVKGVVVVAEGAEKTKVKLDILSAVETILEVDRDKITILS